MAHELSLDDFRARRWVLDPDDFAMSDGKPDPPASDLIPEKVWQQITHLTDHVTIHTTSYQGSLASSVEASAWLLLEAMPVEPAEEDDHLHWSLLDALDDVRAANHSAIAGFYRLAISSLRTALERVADGAARECGGTPADEDHDERNFSWAIDYLRDQLDRIGLNDAIRAEFGFPLIERKDERKAGALGWVRKLRKALSGYTHASVGKEHGSLWSSNGPVHVPRVFADFESLAVEVVALSMLLARIADPLAALPSRSFGWESRPLPWVAMWKRAWLFLEECST